MRDLTRRGFVKVSSMVGAVLASTAAGALEAQQAPEGNAGGFQSASSPGGPGGRARKGPGIQGVFALCEVTGGGKKFYEIAVQYDAVIDPASLAADTYTTSIFPASRGGGGGMMGGPGGPGGPGMMGGPQNSASSAPKLRPVVAIYTNSESGLLKDRKSIAGMYVITEFARDLDLSAPSTDGDKVSVTSDKSVRTTAGAVYAPSAAAIDNSTGRGNNVMIRGIDAWEQSHW